MTMTPKEEEAKVPEYGDISSGESGNSQNEIGDILAENGTEEKAEEDEGKKKIKLVPADAPWGVRMW